jgi:uncharacterized protein (DUF952 family)
VYDNFQLNEGILEMRDRIELLTTDNESLRKEVDNEEQKIGEVFDYLYGVDSKTRKQIETEKD